MKRFAALAMALMLIFSMAAFTVYAAPNEGTTYVVSPTYPDDDEEIPDKPDKPGDPEAPKPGEPGKPVDPDSPKPGGPAKPGDPDPGDPGKPGKPVGPDSPKPGKPTSPQTGYTLGILSLTAAAAASGAVAVIAGKKASKR